MTEWPSIYDKLLALKIPDVEHSYGDKDAMLYALGVGLGHDPIDRAQLAFVYEKNLKVLPTFALVLGYPGFWVRDLDTGIDWVQIVNGEQGFTLHAPLEPRGTVVGQTRIIEVIDKGAGKGALVYTERKITDKASGELVATVTQTTFCRGDGGFGGPPRESPPPHPDPRARARPGLRSADAAGDGADLSAVRRSQSAARRSRRRQGRRLSAADPARARHLRRGRPRAAQERLRLRSGAADRHGRALLGAGVSGRDHPHRDLARRPGGELPRAACSSATSLRSTTAAPRSRHERQA